VVGIYIFVSCCSFLYFFYNCNASNTHFSSRYTRMLQSLSHYSDGPDYILPDDLSLIQKRSDIIHSAAVLLEKCQLVRYDRVSGEYTFA
jgi:hypothetical protein